MRESLGLSIPQLAGRGRGAVTLVAHGDSITSDDFLGVDNYTQVLAQKIRTQRGLNVTLVQEGTNGISWNYDWPSDAGNTTLITEAAARIDPHLSGRAILILFAGTNGIAIAGHSGATEYADFETYLATRLSAGWVASQIYVVAMLPRTGVSEATRAAYNALLAQGKTTQGYHFVSPDFNALLDDSTDTNGYSDGTHPTVAGAAQIADEIYNEIYTPDIVAPTITSSAAVSQPENGALAHTVTANEAVRVAITGGADAALYSVSGRTTIALAAKDFETPTDADTNNTYVVQVTAYDKAGNPSAPQTITTTITDVSETDLLLDTVATAVRAYSLRKLRVAYSGSAIRVRRSSDNAEQDIGFDGSNNLDTAALATFVGANSGYIAKWYDQSTSASDLIQNSDNAWQPRIVNAGTIYTKNSKPVLEFDGSNDFLFQFTGTPTIGEGSAVLSIDDTPNWSRAFECAFSGTGSAANNIGLIGAGVGTTTWEGSFGGPFNTFSENGSALNATTNAVFGGVLQVTQGTGGTDAAWAGVQVGKERNNSGRFWDGGIGEVILWSADLSSGDRAAVYTDTKTYWGTP